MINDLIQPMVRQMVYPMLGRVPSFSDSFKLSLSNAWTFTRTGLQTYEDVNGVLQTAATDDPAFNYGAGLAQGILLEPAGTNNLKHSEDVTNAVWTKTEVTVGASGNSFNPVMEKVTPSTNNIAHFILQNSSITIGVTYTQTFYVKAEGYDFVQITGSAGFESFRFNIDLTDGTLGNNDPLATSSLDIEDLGGGVYRIAATSTAAATNAAGRMIISPLNADTDARLPAYAGDGTSGVSIAANQLEANAFATSYSKTTTAAATRNATSLTRSWAFPANGISGQIKFRPKYDSDEVGVVRVFSFNDGTASNLLDLHFDGATEKFTLQRTVATVDALLLSAVSTFVKDDSISLRFRADKDGLALWVDSDAVVTSTTADAKAAWTSLLTTITEATNFDGSANENHMTIESRAIWNESRSDIFLSSL